MLASITHLLPQNIRFMLSELPPNVQASVEEIRVRESRPLEISWADRYAFISERGQMITQEALAYKPTRQDCLTLLEMLTNHSLYTFEEELRRGYITVSGGHRVGLAGRTDPRPRASETNSRCELLSIFGSRAKFRVSGQEILPYLVDQSMGNIHHTLIISPPQQGKTTLIRDLARLISRGEWGAKNSSSIG